MNWKGMWLTMFGLGIALSAGAIANEEVPGWIALAGGIMVGFGGSRFARSLD